MKQTFFLFALLIFTARAVTDLPAGSAKKIALLQAAFAIQPRNAETALNIGEEFRALAWVGADDYAARAKEALAIARSCRVSDPK